jgi:phosphoglycolate phosphatase
MPMTAYTAVLFDLDGTITDSAPGITATLAYTFERMGLRVPPQEELIHYVGPPILDSLRDLAGLNLAQSHRALEIYRAKYLEGGVFESTMYPGMIDLLRKIGESDMALSLATSKPEWPATLILEHYGVARYFDHITGASEDESRSAKSDVVAEALRRLRASGSDLSRPIMIGDRDIDVRGSAANDVPAIFVEWGYGTELESAGAVSIAANVGELSNLLFED